MSTANLHNVLNHHVNRAYVHANTDELIQFACQHLPEIGPSMPNKHVNAQSDEKGICLSTESVTLAVDSSFGLRLYYKGQQLSTHASHIPRDYPWFQHDPVDPDDIAGYATRHVARGFRGESPWPESQWPQVGGVMQGEQHWPHRDVAFGPYKLAVVNATGQSKSVMLSQYNDDTPNAYGVINRGIFTLTDDGGVILAVQLDNRSELTWSPWLVLGFAMPQQGTMHNPSAVLAIPAHEDISEPIQTHMTKTWNYLTIAGQKMALINPHAKTLNEPFKKLYANVNWTALAIKGTDYIVLTRSLLQHPEQFFPFLEHGRYFVEVEHTGPRVAKGQTSTVLVRQDIIPIHQLTDGQIKQFSSNPGEFEQDVINVVNCLIQLFQAGKLLVI